MLDVAQQTSVKDRLFGLLEEMLEDTKAIGPKEKILVQALFGIAKRKMTNEQLVEGITAWQDRILPWVLNGSDRQ